MTDFDVFLSYRSSDRAEVERVAEALCAKKLSVFLDRWRLAPGQDWQQALEDVLSRSRAVAVFMGSQGLGPWQEREARLALIRKGREPSLPIIPVLLPGADPPTGFLELLTWVDLSSVEHQDRGLEILDAAIRRQPPGPDDKHVLRARNKVSPYRGLLAFRAQDEPHFFGRDNEIKELLERVHAHSLVAVVGPSGTGKSSVVLAGLLPRLHRDQSHCWDALTIVPTWRPCHALAEAVIDRIRPDLQRDERRDLVEKWGNEIVQEQKSVRALLAEDVLAIQPDTTRLLVFIDQFEELYTACQDENHRRRFLDELLAALGDERIHVVLTVRADFYGRIQGHIGLNARLANAVVNLGPMDDDHLRAVIVEPAMRNGIAIPKPLVDTILADVRAEPGHLPLLAFLLHEMWRESGGRPFDLETYDAVGRVKRAIATRAERVWSQELDDRQRHVTERIFLLLVHVGEGTRDTRRRAHLTEFTEQSNEAALIIRKLASPENRLLVTDMDSEAGDGTVEVSHEALLSEWPRLAKLIEQSRDFLVWRKRVALGVEEWAKRKDKSALLRGRLLTDGVAWLPTRREDLTEDERSLVDESLRATRRANWIRRAVAAVLIVFAVIASWMWRRSDTAARRLELQSLGWMFAQAKRALVHEYPTFSAHAAEMRYWLTVMKTLEDEWLGRLDGEVESLGQSLRGQNDNREAFVDRAMQDTLIPLGREIREWLQKNGDTLARITTRLKWLQEPAGQELMRTYDAQWDEAIASIEASDGAKASGPYQGLRIPRARGLVPLTELKELADRQGLPPIEKLWLFAHLASGPSCTHLLPLNALNAWMNNPASAGIVLVLMPSREFVIASEGDAHSNHRIKLPAFYLARTEATQTQWPPRRGPDGYTADSLNGRLLRSDYPVAGVTWFSARSWCNSMGLRLPNEAEWEYACRAGTKTRYWSGDGENDLERVAWYAKNADGPKTVALKPPNPWGLFDVHGNVWEWCEDEWDDSDHGMPRDGIALMEGGGSRVMRGGAARLYPSHQCASAFRYNWNPSSRLDFGGFRPARSVTD